MTDQKLKSDKKDLENKGRRKAIKKIAAGVGAVATYNVLPKQWTRPIVDQIVMPAHAATSGTSLHDPCTITVVSGDQSTATVTIQVNGYVTPPTANLPTSIVAAGSVTVNTTTAADGTFLGTVTVSGGPGITSVAVVTTVTGADGSANCSVNIPAPGVTTTPSPTTTPSLTTTGGG